MKSSMHTDSKNIFGNRDIVYFGYDTLDIRRNMAIDEVLKKHADTENRFFVRFYDVSRPSVVLSTFDRSDTIKQIPENFDVCRRITGGRPIYIDKNTFQYSITGPLKAGDPLSDLPVTSIHKNLGVFLAGAIEDAAGRKLDLTLGNTSSIRIGDKPVAAHGHGTSPNHSFLYHGLIVLLPWDLDTIEKVLNITPEDSKKIAGLPSMSQIMGDGNPVSFYRDRIMTGFVSKLPKGNVTPIQTSQRLKVLDEAEALYQSKYSNDGWIYNGSGNLLRRDVKFCILFEDVAKPV